MCEIDIVSSLKTQVAELINTNKQLVEDNKENEIIIEGLKAQIKKLESHLANN